MNWHTLPTILYSICIIFVAAIFLSIPLIFICTPFLSSQEHVETHTRHRSRLYYRTSRIPLASIPVYDKQIKITQSVLIKRIVFVVWLISPWDMDTFPSYLPNPIPIQNAFGWVKACPNCWQLEVEYFESSTSPKYNFFRVIVTKIFVLIIITKRLTKGNLFFYYQNIIKIKRLTFVNLFAIMISTKIFGIITLKKIIFWGSRSTILQCLYNFM